LRDLIGKRFGLGHDAIFRLWKAAIKDDEGFLDDAIAATFDRMERVDPVRAEEVVSLTIRRHRGAPVDSAESRSGSICLSKVKNCGPCHSG
jgi:hypothetical protein